MTVMFRTNFPTIIILVGGTREKRGDVVHLFKVTEKNSGEIERNKTDTLSYLKNIVYVELPNWN